MCSSQAVLDTKSPDLKTEQLRHETPPFHVRVPGKLRVDTGILDAEVNFFKSMRVDVNCTNSTSKLNK